MTWCRLGRRPGGCGSRQDSLHNPLHAFTYYIHILLYSIVNGLRVAEYKTFQRVDFCALFDSISSDDPIFIILTYGLVSSSYNGSISVSNVELNRSIKRRREAGDMSLAANFQNINPQDRDSNPRERVSARIYCVDK